MLKKTDNGFSLVELLMVLTVLGILSSLAVPSLLKAKQIAENENAYSTLRTIVTTQVSHYASNGRYGRLDELNQIAGGNLGKITDTNLVRSKFTFSMIPAVPSNEQLRAGFSITATKSSGDPTPYTLNVDESGKIVEPYGFHD